MAGSYHDFWRDSAPATGEVGHDISVCGNASSLTATCRYSCFQYTAEAVRIIGRHDPAANPLFIYLAFGNMHGPVQAPQKYIDLCVLLLPATAPTAACARPSRPAPSTAW